MSQSLENIIAIVVLLTFILVVNALLPKVDLGHSAQFRTRRAMNWLPLGLTYALLYFGRYNLAEVKSALGDEMTKADFGHIKMIGSWVYGVSFLINGPLTDMLGGRRTILLAAAGAAVANVGMGFLVMDPHDPGLVSKLSLLYAMNMYFQSFGAVSIVKVNAHWFHVRERGMIGGVFGILIALGLYFAYEWSPMISHALPVQYVCFIPAFTLALLFIVDFMLVRDRPSDAGFADIETGDATWEANPAERAPGALGFIKDALGRTAFVGSRMLRHPVILTIAVIEFCSGFLRGALMDGFKFYADQTHTGGIVYEHWGLVQCMAGILGGIVAGVISDKLFQSRRGPISAVLYSVIVLGSGLGIFLVGNAALSIVVSLVMLAIIGVHGMLSGTASMDFGGKENAGIAVGIIDGFVYLGVGLQAWSIKYVLPPEGQAALRPENWRAWLLSMVVIGALGLGLATRLWNAKPQSRAASAH